MRKFFIHCGYTIVLSAFLVLLFWRFDLDQRVTEIMYLGNGEWVGQGSRYLQFFYFPMNAILFSVPVYVGLVLLLLSFSKRESFKQFRIYRKHGLYLAFVPLLGAGFFNSVVLKGIFARPRPHEYVNEGVFYYPFQIAQAYWGQFDMSFPSGHVSMAAVFMVFYFVVHPVNATWKRYIQVILGIYVPIWAVVSMIISRVSFGDHFVSDGIFAVLFVYLICFGAAKAMKIDTINASLEKADNGSIIVKHDWVVVLGSLIIPLIIILYFLSRFNGLTTIT